MVTENLYHVFSGGRERKTDVVRERMRKEGWGEREERQRISIPRVAI